MRCFVYTAPALDLKIMVAFLAEWSGRKHLKQRSAIITIKEEDGSRRVERKIVEFPALKTAQNYLNALADRQGYKLSGENKEPPRCRVVNGKVELVE